MVVDVSSYATAPVAEALDFVRPGGTRVLAGVKGFKPIPDFVSDKIVMKEITIRGAIGVTSSGYRSAIRLLESRRVPLEKMHTHDFALRDAELAIRTLAREIPGDESIHSCLLPGRVSRAHGGLRRGVDREVAATRAALGVALESLDGDAARLRLPFAEENSNPGQGAPRRLRGVAGGRGRAGGRARGARRGVGPVAHRGAPGELPRGRDRRGRPAEARLLRRGKELCFVEVDVATRGRQADRPRHRAVRGRFGARAGARCARRGRRRRSDPGPMGPHIGKTPFIAARGLVRRAHGRRRARAS